MHITSRFTNRLLALGAVCAIALPGMAKTGSTSKMSGSKMSSTTASHKSSQVTGTVVSMTADSLTIKPSRNSSGATRTISVPSGAAVTMGKQTSSLSALQPGEKVTIRMNAAGTVTSIKAAPMKGSKMSGGSKMMSGTKKS